MTADARPSTTPARDEGKGCHGCVLVGALLFLGLFVLGGAVMSVAQWRMLREWRPVPAVVLDREVSETYDDEGARSYTPVVRYRYTVGGHEYEATRVHPTLRSGLKGWAERQVRPFAPGSRVTAYYDPARPAESYLVRRSSIFPWLFTLVPLAMMAAVTWLFRYIRRYYAQHTPPAPAGG
jgi:hypothetical protein